MTSASRSRRVRRGTADHIRPSQIRKDARGDRSNGHEHDGKRTPGDAEDDSTTAAGPSWSSAEAIEASRRYEYSGEHGTRAHDRDDEEGVLFTLIGRATPAAKISSTNGTRSRPRASHRPATASAKGASTPEASTSAPPIKPGAGRDPRAIAGARRLEIFQCSARARACCCSNAAALDETRRARQKPRNGTANAPVREHREPLHRHPACTPTALRGEHCNRAHHEIRHEQRAAPSSEEASPSDVQLERHSRKRKKNSGMEADRSPLTACMTCSRETPLRQEVDHDEEADAARATSIAARRARENHVLRSCGAQALSRMYDQRLKRRPLHPARSISPKRCLHCPSAASPLVEEVYHHTYP